MSSALRRRVGDLERIAPHGCPDAFHVAWHTIFADEATGELPPPPTCPTCGLPADHVIEIVYENWRSDDDTPRHIKANR